MKDNIAGITKWILYVLIAIVVILGVLFYTNNLGSEGIIVMIISPIYSFITNPTNVVKLLISLGLMVVVIVIGYSMADNTFTELELEILKTDANTSKLVGMGLYVTYIAFVCNFFINISVMKIRMKYRFVG